MMKQASSHTAIIVGTGFGGIATAFKLKKAGITDFIMLERANDVGGVWRENHYPGAACDVQSHLYSFSFAPNPHWSRDFSEQPEIFQYLKDCALKFGLNPHIRFNHNVSKMAWDSQAGQWTIETSQGSFSAQFVVGAFGVLSDPEIPVLEGIESFKGQVFHSSNWPKDIDLSQKKVAVVGTGASAIQFIPAIQPLLKHMTVFQRTAPWVMPRHDDYIPSQTKKRYEVFPLLEKAERLKLYVEREAMVLGFKAPVVMKVAQRKALDNIRKAIKDPVLRKKVTPNYVMGCKRILLSNTYYPALAQANVSVVTSGIKSVDSHTVTDQQGNNYPVDIIIYGTGFAVKNLPFSHYIYGDKGLTLASTWAGSPRGYMGTTIHGFPNLFLLHGPNIGLGHSSVIYMLEAQADHIVTVMVETLDRNAQRVQPTLAAQTDYSQQLDSALKNTVWNAGGCQSWYLDETGRNSTLWPSFTFSYRNLIRKTKAQGYEFN